MQARYCYYGQTNERERMFSMKHLLSSIDISLPHQNWDDFFDFSRMKIPEDAWTVYCRSHRNLFHRYKNNYIQIWRCMMTITGILTYDPWCLFFMCLIVGTTLFIRNNNIHIKKKEITIATSLRQAQHEKVRIISTF
jgi:hypothetical protein